ncbi:HEAT repeat domain-containing protein [Pseudodesulfovibrio sediminis]|uniref:PBS lyase HEAT domain protein repeat-containing protein n=1 Tax=Pseudodesulfovibrio sediminis TaxID=2810563 RepID=A0ABM7P7G9_9BACT|nr:HEAT repeat domain-containing protein [Pseudodesulfovibrio sediminis]BCS88896.1 hypothetical protein PSDVSF_21380 [Pseudodesulfovibrio sediminis]
MKLDSKLKLSMDKLLPILLTLCVLIGPCPALAGTTTTTETASIAHLLGSKERTDRDKGGELLKAVGQSAMPDLLQALKSPENQQRRGAVFGLALLPIPALTTDGLISALSDKDPVIRRVAALALAKISRYSAKPVARLLADPNNDVRVSAALSLSKMGADAVLPLADMLSNTDPVVVAKAAWLLGILNEQALPATPALVRALEIDDMRVVHVLAETIDQIGPDPAMLHDLLLLLGSERMTCPGSPIGAAAAPTVAKLLARPGTLTAQVALYTLARMGKLAMPALTQIAKTGTPSQQTAAALLLSGLDPKSAKKLPDTVRRSLTGAFATE